MPANRRTTGVSYSASSINASLSTYHYCSKWLRSMVASEYG